MLNPGSCSEADEGADRVGEGVHGLGDAGGDEQAAHTAHEPTSIVVYREEVIQHTETVVDASGHVEDNHGGHHDGRQPLPHYDV